VQSAAKEESDLEASRRSRAFEGGLSVLSDANRGAQEDESNSPSHHGHEVDS